MEQIQTEQKDGANHIYLPTQCGPQFAEALEKSMKQWLLMPESLHLLHFKGVLQMHHSSRVHFVNFKKALEKVGKKMMSLDLSKTILEDIKNSCLTGVFSPQASEKEALIQAGLAKAEPESKKRKVDVRFLNPFITGTLNVLGVQANLQVKPDKPRVKDPEKDGADVGIAGIISLDNDYFAGSIALCFSKGTFLKIYSNMIGEDVSEIDDEVKDLAGELLNMIYGHAKTVLNKDGHGLEMAIPTVLTGEKLKIQFKSKSKTILLPFNTEAGSFHIEVIIDPDFSNSVNGDAA